MKVLIQDMESRLYLDPRRGWTNNVTKADDFGSTTLAYNFARQMICGPFQVILHIHETRESIPFIEGMGRAVLGQGA